MPVIHCRYDELLPISRLKPFPQNRNQHTSDQITRLAKLIDAHGMRAPVIVAKEHGYIAKGHGTVQALRELGETTAPVVYQSFDSDEQLYAFVQSDNAIAAWAGLDLSGINADVGDLGPDFDLDLLGIKDFTLDVAEKNEDTGGGALPPNPLTRPGDIWSMGNHRLLCGDSTYENERLIEDIFAVREFAACITDPPYSVDYDKSHASVNRLGDGSGGRGGLVQAGYSWDSPQKLNEVLAFMEMIPADVLVMTYPVDRHFFALAEAMQRYGFEFRKELVWVKDNFSFWPGAQYQQKHEPILVCAKKGKPLGSDVPANVSTVFEIAKPRAHDLHPTAKPLELWDQLVRYHVPAGETFYEPFCGSGTGIISAEREGRTCVAVERSPQYVDVAVKRWADLTGRDPVRHDGVAWSAVTNLVT